MIDDPSGSNWRKWDLHFHTPASFDYENKSITNEEIIDALQQAGVAAVAVTDHHFIDVQRIKNLQDLGKNRITVFPGIEFRTELGGKETIHCIGIFPESAELEETWTKLQGKLAITPGDVRKKGNEKIYVQFTEACKVIKELGGLVSVHAGKKTNSIENIGNNEDFKMAFKKDLVEQHIDIYEAKSPSDVQAYRTKVFPNLGFTLPVITGSDNHNIKDYKHQHPCWIKADCTFQGLVHVLNEPIDRIFIGERPHALERVHLKKTKYLESISIRKKQDSDLDEHWFDSDIKLNSGLVAIVGNKGSGKSALADIIGLLGSSKNSRFFSFLSSSRFKQPKKNRSEQFIAEATWRTTHTVRKSLADKVNEEETEIVNYLPQDFLERICNSIEDDTETSFGKALRQVIYSHVSDPERLGFGSLDELLDYKTKETIEAIELQKRELTDRLKNHLVLIDKSQPSYKKSLENDLETKRAELNAHENARPQEVSKPETGSCSTNTKSRVEKDIEDKENELKVLTEKINSSLEKQAFFTKKLVAAKKLLQRMDNIEASIRSFASESVLDLVILELTVESILKFDIDRNRVEKILFSSNCALETCEKSLGDGYSGGLLHDRGLKLDELESLKAGLDAPNKRFQEYLFSLNKWQERLSEIVGNPDTPATIEFMESRLAILKDLPDEIEKSWGRCLEISRLIHIELNKLSLAHRNAFKAVQNFVENHKLAKQKFDLSFDSALVANGFSNKFLSFINQGRRGTFNGVNEGRQRIDGILAASDFESWLGVESFLSTIHESLQKDERQTPAMPVSMSDQMVAGPTSCLELLSFVLGLEYIRPKVRLRWAGKDIEQLSPGERGTLLLVFYLLIDKSDTPLVIDQPEENLDNQTVVDFLVPSIKEARERRQIILVTHNPNLAVVCDADQVIYASIDKNDGNRISYESGAIENPRINQRIVDVLEGTRSAFDNRDSKYQSENSQDRPRLRSLS
jgi:ABC-type lipoprotein export system ATPase subunit